jgi:hypothetical protein
VGTTKKIKIKISGSVSGARVSENWNRWVIYIYNSSASKNPKP